MTRSQRRSLLVVLPILGLLLPAAALAAAIEVAGQTLKVTVPPPNSGGGAVGTGGTVRPIAPIDLGFTVTHHSSNIALPLYGPVRTALLGPSDSTGFDWAPMFASSARERVSRSTGVVEANIRLLRWLTAHEAEWVGGERLRFPTGTSLVARLARA